MWELGLVLWILIGWQFTLAEFVGGLIMIALMTLALRAFVPPPSRHRRASTRSRPTTGHEHHAAGARAALA